nr:L393 [uncultured bacterium]
MTRHGRCRRCTCIVQDLRAVGRCRRGGIAWRWQCARLRPVRFQRRSGLWHTSPVGCLGLRLRPGGRRSRVNQYRVVTGRWSRLACARRAGPQETGQARCAWAGIAAGRAAVGTPRRGQPGSRVARQRMLAIRAVGHRRIQA